MSNPKVATSHGGGRAHAFAVGAQVPHEEQQQPPQ